MTNEAHETARKILSEHREQHKIIAEALLKYETLDEKQILSLYNTGQMPDKKNDSEFPSEKAATFEQSKRELERREAERQAKILAKNENKEDATETSDAPQSDSDSDQNPTQTNSDKGDSNQQHTDDQSDHSDDVEIRVDEKRRPWACAFL